MKKIFIIGSSGSGKSYLAKILSKKYKIKHFDLDDIFWEQKYSKKRSEANKKKEVTKIIQKNNGWIIEGIFHSFVQEIIKEADEIIWLDIHKNILSWRIFKRYWKRRKQKNETLKSNLSLINWARNYRKNGYYDKHKQMLENKKYILIKNKKDFNNYLKKL